MSPVVVRVLGSLPPTNRPRTSASTAITSDARSIREPNSATIVLQFTANPATSASPSARFAIFTSSGCHVAARSA